MTKVIKFAFGGGIILLGAAFTGEATLIDRGNGLIYDPCLDITWLADANYAQTSGYDADGRMNWSQAMAWADQLVYAGYDNWRLPSTLQPDPSCVERESASDGPYLYDCSGSEMGHLFYNELGGVPDIPHNSATYGPNEALFSNLQHLNYWSSTEASPGDVFPSCTTDCVWDFDFKNGVQTGYRKNLNFYALAVHPGDIGGLATVTLNSLRINGPTSVNESSTASYTARATWSDGSTSTVTSSAVWSENSSYATISSNSGVLTTSLVSTNKSVRITARYTSGGVTRSDTHNVTITDVPVPIFIEVTGGGRVTSESMTTDCWNDCETTHDLGSTVTFEAIASSGWVFDQWTGASCTVFNSQYCQVDVLSPTTISSVFLKDTDGDGIANITDQDDDNDGVNDALDAFPLDVTEWLDTDGDGQGDNSDVFPNDATETLDMDGDGIGDNSDVFPADPEEWLDADSDGYGNNQDADDDNDGLPDWLEQFYGLNAMDHDDALGDLDMDGFSNLAEYLSGSNLNHLMSMPDRALIIDTLNPAQSFDTDMDSITNDLDIDDDNDGVEDTLDYFPIDGTEWTDSDNDHVGDNEDVFPNDISEWLDSDLDGLGDNSDTDDDNDGVLDIEDAYPLDPSKSYSEKGGALSIWMLFTILMILYQTGLRNKI